MPPATTATEPRSATISAIDVADALLCVLVSQRAAALLLSPNADAYEAQLVRVASPETVMRLPLGLGHAVAARLAMIGGLDPWALGDRLGRIDVRIGQTHGEFVVLLRDTQRGFAAELRRLVAHGDSTATIAELEVGRGRIGPYRLEREIGRGAMGIVYRATREGQTTPVAIKLLNPSLAADPGTAARFVREGRAAALVNDPGVVGVTDFGTLPDGRAFLVMELVEGRTLEEALTERASFPPAEALRIAQRIAGALEAAHVRGVVHRDLKPSNIFLIAGGGIKIADFGAALVLDLIRGQGHAEESVVLGTPAYMAPEQAQSLPSDERVDLYSLGCILYRMLSGAPPFRGGALMEVLLKHISEPAPPVTSPSGPLPPVLVDAVARALAKRPEDRFRSAGELRAMLEQAGLLVAIQDRKGTLR